MASPWDALPVVGSFIGANQDRIQGQKDRDFQSYQAKQNRKLQKEFAQMGIRWRVEDAKAAGLHPLAALGASGASYTPVSTGSVSTPSMAEFGHRMGQDISRAVSSGSTGIERQLQGLQVENAKLDLEGKSIDNQIRASQLRKLSLPSPAVPGADTDNFIPGQPNAGLVINKPAERVVSAPGRPAQEAGWRPDVSFSRTDTGLVPMIPQGLSESLEDDFIGKLMWRARNQFLPNFSASDSVPPPSHMLPKGHKKWEWSVWKQEWQPRKWR